MDTLGMGQGMWKGRVMLEERPSGEGLLLSALKSVLQVAVSAGLEREVETGQAKEEHLDLSLR